MTGPGALGRSFQQVTGEWSRKYRTYENGIRIWAHRKVRPSVCSIAVVDNGSQPLLYTRYVGYRREMRWYSDNQQPYWNLYRWRMIYNKPLGDSRRPPPALSSEELSVWNDCPLRLPAKFAMAGDGVRHPSDDTALGERSSFALPNDGALAVAQYVDDLRAASAAARDAIAEVAKVKGSMQHVLFTNETVLRWLATLPCNLREPWLRTANAALREAIFGHLFVFLRGGFSLRLGFLPFAWMQGTPRAAVNWTHPHDHRLLLVGAPKGDPEVLRQLVALVPGAAQCLTKLERGGPSRVHDGVVTVEPRALCAASTVSMNGTLVGYLIDT